MSEQYKGYNNTTEDDSLLKREYALLFDTFAKDINLLAEEAIIKLKNCQINYSLSDLKVYRKELHKLSNEFHDNIDRMIKSVVSNFTNQYKQGKLF